MPTSETGVSCSPHVPSAMARKQGNLDFCPCLILSLSLVPCSSTQVRALLERDCLGGPEIKATVLGETSDSCYNINTGSRHKLVYEVMFFVLGRLFCYFPKRVKSGLIWILAAKLKHAFKEGGWGRKLQASNCRWVFETENSEHSVFDLPCSGKGWPLGFVQHAAQKNHQFSRVFGFAAARMRTFQFERIVCEWCFLKYACCMVLPDTTCSGKAYRRVFGFFFQNTYVFQNKFLYLYTVVTSQLSC